VGLEVRGPGYNVFVCGLSGTGRTATILGMLRALAPACPVPRDRAYVHCFREPLKPRLLTLPAGKATDLRTEMVEFVALLRRTIPALLEDREFLRRRDEITRRFGEEEQGHLDAFRRRLDADGFALVELEIGALKRPDIFPVFEGKPIPPDQAAALVEEGKIPRAEAEAKDAKFREHRRELAALLRTARELARRMGGEVGEVLKQTVRNVIAGPLEDIRDSHEDGAVNEFLAEVEGDVLENILRLAREAEGGLPEDDEGRFPLYSVNVLVDRRGLQGCPVLSETSPTTAGLFGTIERRAVGPGRFRADHTMVRAGSLLRADGGFLILDIADVLAEPEVWGRLRRTLKHRRLEIRTSESPLAVTNAVLAPEAIDLDTKVILVGDWRIHHLLHRGDPEFPEIFRVKVDFEPDMDASPRNLEHFARVVAKLGAEGGFRALEREGLAALIEYGVRASGRQGKITARFSEVGDVVREADFWASQEGAARISGVHVLRAIERREERNRFEEGRVDELLEKGVLLVETDGRRVGRVNGLSVYDLGYHAFGKPTLITASAGVGQAGIINVEREARLSGGIYDKGVLIIAGYLRRTFAQERPLTLTASLCFEQSYAGVDGDSASVAEVAALLSELSGTPVDQGLAVTGSLNQHGDVQPIGGVNEKVEGFFRLCRRRGLTGRQGVVLPAANLRDLMLDEDVVEGVRAGRFHVYAVTRVEEAVEILLDADPGRREKDGSFTRGSVYALADARLEDYASRLSAGEDWKPVPATGPAPPPPAPPPTPGRRAKR